MKRNTNTIPSGFIRLDRRKKEGLASQLYAEIRDAILTGRLKSGARLPSSRDFADDCKVSRTTVISAFDQLLAEGYLTSAVGRGTFVSDRLPDESMRLDASTRTPGIKRRSGVTKQPTTAVEVTDSTRKQRSLSTYSRLIDEHDAWATTNPLPRIPFAPGIPALDEFPMKLWTKLYRQRLSTIQANQLSYGSAAGVPQLREAIAEYVQVFRGVQCTAEQIFVVAGTQFGLSLVARLLVDPGDRVIIENPGYPRAHQVFRAARATIIPVDVDDFGLVPERLEQAKLVYVTPSHQFPMGVTLSVDRRIALIDWARQTNSLIIEDDYDSEYRYSQRPIPSLQGMDDGQNTIYIGSFSKVVFPGLSLGYVIVPPWLVDSFEKLSITTTRPPSTLDQIVVADFLTQGHFARHLRRMRQIHGERRQSLVKSLEKHLSSELKIIGEDAGLHCATVFRNQRNDVSIVAALNKIGIVARPLSQYTVPAASSRVEDRKPSGTTRRGKYAELPGLIFGFAGSKPRQIQQAVSQMRQVFDD